MELDYFCPQARPEIVTQQQQTKYSASSQHDPAIFGPDSTDVNRQDDVTNNVDFADAGLLDKKLNYSVTFREPILSPLMPFESEQGSEAPAAYDVVADGTAFTDTSSVHAHGPFLETTCNGGTRAISDDHKSSSTSGTSVTLTG